MRLIDGDALMDIYANRLELLGERYWPDSSECGVLSGAMKLLEAQPTINPSDRYEYHYDHTDCIWYRPEARNRCPVTCAQYRDGWNDAMNYIFRDGEGYRPFRRDKKYEAN